MKLSVREERPVVTSHALRLADEKPQALDFIRLQCLLGCAVVSQYRINIVIQRGRLVLQ